MTDRTKGILCVLAAAVCWSLGGVLIKSTAASPGAVACYRSGVAGLLLMAWLVRQRRCVAPDRRVVALGLAYAATMFSFVIAMRTTSAAAAIALQYTAPAWVLLMGAMFLKEKPTARQIPALVLCGIGAVLFFVGRTELRVATGNAVALFSGLAFGTAMVLMRGLRDRSALYLAGMGNLIAFAFMLPGAACWSHEAMAFTAPDVARLAVGWGDVLLIVVMGSVQTAVPYALFARGARHLQAYEASLVCLIEPILNPLWVFLILAHVPTGNMVWGAACILVGVAVVSLRRGKAPPMPVAD